jgi:ASC-1-like (ASCH) protein
MTINQPDVWDHSTSGVQFPENIPASLKDAIDSATKCRATVHLAILREPFLSLILGGRKRIESRFTTKRIAPFGQIAAGDLVILKQASGAVRGWFIAGATKSMALSDAQFDQVQRDYDDAICGYVDPQFWQSRRTKRYCTLIEVAAVDRVEQFHVRKHDQRAWVVFKRLAEEEVHDVA